MDFTESDYIAQGFYPPCKGARYIPTSSPFVKGMFWLDRDTWVTYVAWEQRVMKTGGDCEIRLWWVPLTALQ